MATKKVYSQLKKDQRSTLYILQKYGYDQRTIAQELGVDQSTISRELKRNSDKKGYCFKQAEKFSRKRKSRSNRTNSKKTDPKIIELVFQKMRQEQWSPEQISGWLKKERGLHISHETIYQYVFQDKARGGNLYLHLRHKGKKYQKRGSQYRSRGIIPDRIDIDQRPDIVDQKIRVGDWELDTIIGKNHKGALVSAVERVSKLTKLMLIDHKTMDEVAASLKYKLAPLKEAVITCTSDNGKEFAAHKHISYALETEFYFAKPYHSWQRGLNEHTNGLVRQYFSKQTAFDTISQDDVLRVQNLLNTRPRKALNFQTPLEVFMRAFPSISLDALRF